MEVITAMDLNNDTMLTATGNDEIVDTVDIILNLAHFVYPPFLSF